MEVLKIRPIAVDVKPWIGTIQIVMAAICWGTLGIFSTYLSQLGFSSWQITILRIITAAIIAIAMLPKIWKPLSRLTLGQWFGLGLQSLIGVLGMTVCYLFAVLHVGAGTAVALLYTAPVFSLIFSHLLLDERITYKAALLAVVAVIGVGMTTMGGTTEGKLGIAVGLLLAFVTLCMVCLVNAPCVVNTLHRLSFLRQFCSVALCLLFIPPRIRLLIS